MENVIKEIMEELFAIDPDLKKYQKELEATMVKMIANKPKDKFDENFRHELKMKLLARAEELEKEKSARPILWKNLVFWRSLTFATAMAVIVLVIVVPAVRDGQFIKDSSPLSLFSGKINIEKTGERAFGDLVSSEQSLAVSESDSYSGITAPAAIPQASSSVSREAAGFGGGGGANASVLDMKALPPEYMTKYNYIYVGEDFSFTEESVEVLKRIKNYGSENLGSVLGNLSFGIFDASKLSNVKVQTMSLAEDRDGGYIVDFNPYEGIISFYENWQRAIPVDYEAQPRLQESDVPSDEKLIEVANNFLSRYGISRENYGVPLVSQGWKLGYARVPAAEIWIPDTMTVQYPLMFDDREAWEQGGYEKAGFSVNINIRTMQVVGLYGLATQNYQSSNYAAETDRDRLLKFALQGDIRSQPTYPEENFQVKEVEVKLGTPSVQYMRYWKYEGNQSSELFLPSLVFPIIDKSQAEEYFTKQVVVIPLVREILDNAEREDIANTPVLLENKIDAEDAPPPPIVSPMPAEDGGRE